MKFDGVSLAPQLRGEKVLRANGLCPTQRQVVCPQSRVEARPVGMLYSMKNAPYEQIAVARDAKDPAADAARKQLQAALDELNPTAAKEKPAGTSAKKPRGKAKKKRPQNRCRCEITRPAESAEHRRLCGMSYWVGKTAIVTGASADSAFIWRKTWRKPAPTSSSRANAVEARSSGRQAGRTAGPCRSDRLRRHPRRRCGGAHRAHRRRVRKLDLLINNAGLSVRKAILETTPADFEEMLALNLLATVRCTRAAAPHLIASHGHLGQHRFAGRQSGVALARCLIRRASSP